MEEENAMKKNSGKRMNGKTKSIIALCIVAVLTIFFGIVGVTGMNLTPDGLYKLKSWLPTTNADNWPSSLSLGLDLRGGVYVEYSCKAPENSEADFATLMNGTIRVIQERLTDKGYTEATVQQIGSDGIRVEILGLLRGPSQICAALRRGLKLRQRHGRFLVSLRVDLFSFILTSCQHARTVAGDRVAEQQRRHGHHRQNHRPSKHDLDRVAFLFLAHAHTPLPFRFCIASVSRKKRRSARFCSFGRKKAKIALYFFWYSPCFSLFLLLADEGGVFLGKLT